MFRRTGHVLLIVALLTATGAHWALLQSVAWTTMLAANLRSGSLSEAVEHTFDGRHPCCLCRQIAAGKKSEKKSEFPLQLKKFEFLSGTPGFAFAAPASLLYTLSSGIHFKSVCRTPPSPPPRGFFV